MFLSLFNYFPHRSKLFNIYYFKKVGSSSPSRINIATTIVMRFPTKTAHAASKLFATRIAALTGYIIFLIRQTLFDFASSILFIAKMKKDMNSKSAAHVLYTYFL